MLPIAHWSVRVQGIGEDMPSNMLSFTNFELLELYWTYFLTLQTTTPKIPPMRLMNLDHEPKMRRCVMSLNHGFWRLFLCKYGLFWALKEILPKFIIMLMWCGLPMKWNHMVWKIYPQHLQATVTYFKSSKNLKFIKKIKKKKSIQAHEMPPIFQGSIKNK